MKDTPLDETALKAALSALSGWSQQGDALVKTFKFEDFRAAMSFLFRVAFEADKMDHHPEWTNVYDRVEVKLCTHSAGDKITAKDVALAKAMEQVANG